jgi:hypothetical protein
MCNYFECRADVRYFGMLHKECPTCGVEFAKLSPMANMVPHWQGTCFPKCTCPCAACTATGHCAWCISQRRQQMEHSTKKTN